MQEEQKRRITTTVVDVGAMEGECLDDRFRLVRRVGEGGYGAVFEALQLSVDRTCAVKVLASRLGADELSRRRFHVEARATAELVHPNTVTLFDFGVDDTTGVLFLAMEMLDGPTLQSVVSEHGLLPVGAAVSIVEAMAGSLQEAHDKGLVHRDIKPSNVICTDVESLLAPGRGGHVPVKLIDFGIAKSVSADSEWAGEEMVSGGGLTRTGMMVGTPTYMSPEQIRGEEVDGRVDQYALAMTTYWLVTGKTPYAGSSALEVASRHLTEPPLPLTSYRPELQVPPAFEDVLLKALSKEPSNRFEDMDAFAEACVSTLSWSGAERGVVPAEVDGDEQESVETATIKGDEARQTPRDLPSPMTDETERTRVVAGGENERPERVDERARVSRSTRRYRGHRLWRLVRASVSGKVGARVGMAGMLGVIAVVGGISGTWLSAERETPVDVQRANAEVASVDGSSGESGGVLTDRVRTVVTRAVWAGRLRSVSSAHHWSAVGWLGSSSSESDRSGKAVQGVVSNESERAGGPAAEEGDVGSVVVRMIPWGTLYIDGRRVGQGVVSRREVSAGKHRVVIRQGKRVVRDVTIEVEEGERRELEVRVE